MLAALLASAARAEPRWSELNREARTAIAAADYSKLRATLLELAPLMPGNARIAYNLAASAAKLGRRPAAFAGVHALCEMALAYDLNGDDDFATLRGSTEFNDALACMKRNTAPLTHAHKWITLAATDLLPEDLAYDPKTKRIFVSSIAKNLILDTSGKVFATMDLPVLALAVDAKRRTLWATAGWMPQCERCAASAEGRTALLAFNLDTRKVTHWIESADPGLFGDMTISRAGDVHVSEGLHGAVLELVQGAKAFERLDAAGEFPSPQQPALSADEKTLYVPDYIRGIAAIDLATRGVTWLTPAPGIAVSGIDGLRLHGNSFYAVQNGTQPARIIRFSIDLQQQQVLEANWPGLGEPTHGLCIGGDHLFIANTGWTEYDEHGGKRAGSAPVTSEIWKLRLHDSRD